MRITAVMLLMVASMVGMLGFSVTTLCSPHVNPAVYFKMVSNDADAFIFENTGFQHAIIIFDDGKVYLSPGSLPPEGKVTSYMGVEMRVENDTAWAVLNGILITGKLDLVKKTLKTAITGENRMNIPWKRAVCVYILRKHYCPYTSEPKVVWVERSGDGYAVHIYYDTCWKVVHVKSLKLAKMYSTKLVKRVLAFTVNASDLRVPVASS